MHPWKFVSSEVNMVEARLTHSFLIEKWEKEYLQELLISIGYFEGAKFTWVGMTVRCGLKNETKTHFEGLDKKYECIDIAKQLDMRILLTADENDVDMLMDFFKIAALDSLIDAGKKYKLKESAIEALKAERAKLGQIPDWEYEMEEHPEIMLEKYKASVPKY
jgi:hypothetical protein